MADPAFEKFKNDLFRTFMQQNKEKFVTPSVYELFMGFVHAVRWTEVCREFLGCPAHTYPTN